MLLATLAAGALSGCTVTDGDTIRCGAERIRLIGIDAPEMGNCPRWRDCVEGDGSAARDELRRAMAGRRITVQRVGQDRYGRTLAVVYANGVNLSCHMLAAGKAEYVDRWDNGHLVARDCPRLAR